MMAAAAAWLFYQSRIAVVILSPFAFPYCLYRLKGEREKKKKILSEQFRELLGSVNNALRSGDSPENAFREGYREMVYEYGEYAPITRELTWLVGGLDNRIPLEKLLDDLAERAGTEEIREFAEIFRIAKRGGGNMTEILSRTAALIEERLDVENEISIMLGNRRLEQRIMDVTPFMIIFYIGIRVHDAVPWRIPVRTGSVGEDTGGDTVNETKKNAARLRRKGEGMEIYIYGLILAAYLVLWFVSRGSEGKGAGRIAEYLYERGRAWWFVSRGSEGKGAGRIAEYLYERGRAWGQKIGGGLLRESGVRRDLSLLYPYGRLQGEEKKFCVGRIRIALLIILAGDILAVAGYAAAEGNMLLRDGELIREEIGGEDRSTELEAYVVQEAEGGDISKVHQGDYRLEVRSRKFSENEARSMADEVFALLPERILGENESLGRVTKPLDLPGTVEGYPFEIAWESSSYALVDADGTVGNSGMGEGESREVTLTAILSYDNGIGGGLRWSREYPVTVFGPELSAEDALSLRIREAIQSADARSVSETAMPLPYEMEEESLYWEEKPAGTGMAMLVFSGIVAFLAAAVMGSRLHERVVQRERQMMLDYPRIISKFVLYLGAGLSIRSTFIRLGEEYTKRRAEGLGEQSAYEEILLVCRELASGVPEADAYADFGQRCRSRQYTRLRSVMQQEAKASFEERQNTARKLGEEAETKLLLPMIMMLAITMLIIIIPAYYSFAA